MKETLTHLPDADDRGHNLHDNLKDQARLAFQASHRRQDHGSRQGYKGHDHIDDAFYSPHALRPSHRDDIDALRADTWSPDDQATEEAGKYMHFLYHDDPAVIGYDDYEDLETSEPVEEFAHIEERRALAEVLLGQLTRGEIDKQQAWLYFEAGTGLFEDGPLYGQMENELGGHFKYSGRMAAAKTLDHDPFEDTDYHDGFTIHRM